VLIINNLQFTIHNLQFTIQCRLVSEKLARICNAGLNELHSLQTSTSATG